MSAPRLPFDPRHAVRHAEAAARLPAPEGRRFVRVFTHGSLEVEQRLGALLRSGGR